jgi:hypothetical protein
MVMATLPFPQERDVNKTPEPSTPLPNPRTGDGRFAKGNPGDPDWPRGASSELIKVAIELARAGNLEALKLARVWRSAARSRHGIMRDASARWRSPRRDTKTDRYWPD